MELLGILLMSFLGSILAFGMMAGLIGHFIGQAFARLLKHFSSITSEAFSAKVK